MNIQKWLEKSIKKLSNVDNPKYESELLLSYVARCNRSHIMSIDHIRLHEIEFKYLEHIVYRRSLGEPIAYIVGKKEFWSLSLYVSYDTLIPRPDTEILVEQALSKINNDCCTILDLGTGCGAISLALASICPTWNIIGIDNSKKAIKIAQLNALKFKFKNVSFIYSNWFSHIDKKFNIIISNPPYISKQETKLFKQDIFFEPINAIVSDSHGLSDIELIIKKASCYLLVGGWLFIEHGWKQKLKVQFLFKKYNFFDIQSYIDYGGNDRVTAGRHKYNK